MFNRLKNALKKEPEHSVALRLIIFAAMMVPLPALARVRPDLTPHVLIAALGIGTGHWVSYHTRNKPSTPLRLVTFIAIHLALCWMFVGLSIGSTVPQAQFAIFAQAITSFDLRYRSNLFNTLIHSLANLYVAATLARSTELALYLLLFGALVLVAFYVAERDSGLQTGSVTPTVGQKQPLATTARPLLLFGFSFGGITLLALIVVFLFTPRYANRPIVPPFSLNLPLRGGASAEIINPGVPLVQVNGWSDGTSDYYYGFDTNLDLRYRGGLSDALVMYVRSPSRSHSYDTYNGTTWQQSDTTLTALENRGVYFELPAPLGSPQAQEILGVEQPDGSLLLRDPAGPPRHLREVFNTADPTAVDQSWRQDQQIVQTFNIVRNLPNLIFAAYRPAEIFLSTERVSLDRGDGLRLPESLKAGMTYSVVSYRPEFNPAALRQPATKTIPPDIARRYLQLPDNISARVRQLALNLTAPHDNTFDKITALNNHLLAEYPYNFYPPPHPPGAEVVDQFLFVDQEGVCEQYVTALVVMARSLGIPARLAAGYGSGQHNAITGYYEVRYSDAHSWAEVYFPDHGWVPFDPTPGWTPQPYPTPAQNWLFANNGQLFSQLTGLNLPLGAMASGALAGAAFFTPFLIGATLLVGLVLLVWFLFKRFKPLWVGNKKRRYSAIDGNPARRQILALYRQGSRVLRRRKHPQRKPWETVTEYAHRVGNFSPFDRLSQLAEVAAYRPQPPDSGDIAQAKTALKAIKTKRSTDA